MSIDVDALVAAARATTGLHDLGSGDPLEGLRVLADSADRQARFNAIGEAAFPAMLGAALENRLRVVDWLAQHPEVTAERIEAPLVVIGMFRAGTTLLSRLLDQDPANRALLGWEARDTTPPPVPGAHRSGPRVDAAQAASSVLSQLNPTIDAAHHEAADEATECISVMAQDFKSMSWEAVANLPDYSAWLLAVDQHSAYEYHRCVLQILQSGGVRGRWTLKSPHHGIALEPLTTVYPDARLVLLHRDPVVLCASVCSLVETITSTFSDADHRAYLGRHWSGVLLECATRIDAFRAARPDVPVVDVQYADLVADPVETVARLYAAGGEELSGTAADAMAAYVARNPKDRFGVHRYDLAPYGLDPDEIRERFAGYVERSAVTPET